MELRRRALRLLVLIALAAMQTAGGEASCEFRTSTIDDPISDDPRTGPGEDPVLFEERFVSGLGRWVPAIPYPPSVVQWDGVPPPSITVGSASLGRTGAVTVALFDFTDGLTIETDVYLVAPTTSTMRLPELWVGLSADTSASNLPSLAAGQYVDANNVRHFIINGAIVASTVGPSRGVWHRLSMTIRNDRAVEFRMDGRLDYLSSAVVSTSYVDRPVRVGGAGHPEWPLIDNVVVTRP